MLTIHLVVIGERMPDWVEAGFAEYQKRIRGRMSLNLIEVAAIKRGKNADLKRIQREEDERLLNVVPAGSRIIALDRSGRTLSTLQMKDRIEDWMTTGQPVALLVGGPEGLSQSLIDNGDERWSLSALTFAHPVVRVVLAEQVYRCYSILENLPYHR